MIDQILKCDLCLGPFNAPHAARCVACQGVRSDPVPVARVGECSMPVLTA